MDCKIPFIGAKTHDHLKYESSYEEVNRDTALIPVQILANDKEKKRSFVFISAERGLPISSRYLATKREVEDVLLKNHA